MSGLLSLAFCGTVFWSQFGGAGRFDPYSVGPEGTWPSDVLVGLATTCLLIHGAQKSAVASGVVRLLSARPLVAIGTFSYSLYLVHHPVLQLASGVVRHLHLDSVPSFMLFVTVGGGGAVAVAYTFFLAFERPFLVHRKNETAAEVARDAALSPAP